MAKINPDLINSILKDLQEISFVSENMLPTVVEKDFLSWLYPNKLSKDVKINTEIFENLDGGEYVLILELIIERLYLIINLAVEYLRKDTHCKTAAKDISLGVITTIFWKKLQNSSGKSTNSDIVAKRLVNQLESLYTSPCKTCLIVMDFMKTIIKNVEDCMKKLKKDSAVKMYRLTSKQDIIELSQNMVMKNWIESVTRDLRIIVEYSLTNREDNLNFKKNMSSIEDLYQNSLKKSTTLKEEIDQLKCNQSEAEKTIEKLNNVLKQTEKKYNEVKTDLSKNEEDYKIKIKKIENELQMEDKNNQKILQELEEKLKIEKEIEKQATELRITNLQDEIKLNSDKYEKQIEEMEQNYKTERENEKRKAESSYSELFTRYIKTKNENEEQITNLESKMVDMRKNYEIEILTISEKVKGEIDVYRKLAEGCKEKYTNCEKIINELKEKLEIEEKNVQNLRERLKEKKEEYDAEIEYEMNKMKEENTKIKAYYEKSTTELNRINKEFQAKTEELTRQNNNLKTELENSKQREYTLLQCPDLNGPIVAEKCDKKDPLADMEKQMESNQIRIELLQKQNNGLQRTVGRLKMLQMRQ